MLGKSAAGGHPRRESGGSMATSNECPGEKAKEKQGDRGATKTVDGTQDAGSDQDHIQDAGVHNEFSGNDERFGHKAPRRDLIQNLNHMPSTPMADASSARLDPRQQSNPCSLDPPVTKATLSELDVPRIVLNPKLRHDINFDPDLHFRPNLEGEKGRRKAQRAAKFWTTLRTELRLFMGDPIKFEAEHADRDWRLPVTLRAVEEILETLVPPEDRSSVGEILNVPLLMQQFAKGVADLEDLAAWLSRTLKMHCAPMRDDWVNEMVSQLGAGNQNQDVSMLVQGLQTLLGVLEAMKLDVANHQIRCLRSLLVQDTIEFEQTYFMKKIAFGKINISFAHSWFQSANGLPEHALTHIGQSQRDLRTFFRGFSHILLPSRAAELIPDTFTFDGERIIKARSDILDAINMEVCMSLFRDLKMNPSALPCPIRSSLASQMNSTISSHQEDTLRSSIVAILADIPVEPQWQEGLPAIALQILRSMPANLSDLPEFERELQSHLSNPSSPLFLSCEAAILGQLYPLLEKLVACYSPLSTTKLFEISVLARVATDDAEPDASVDVLKEMARRIAHMGILHWRVWAPLAYLVNPDAAEPCEQDLVGDAEDIDAGMDSVDNPAILDTEMGRRQSGKKGSLSGSILAKG
ncbi:MAG: hypothetical protein M1818_006749 [Claussenomyces sp. TS43310]|nr:MAG: hypothetical protein M1818_006749 [Claussenomyces sp. TS43310]